MMFRKQTTSFSATNCYVRSTFVKEALRKEKITSNFFSACYSEDLQVKKELRMNLLEHMISLFFNVRMFSHAKDIKEQHKIQKKESRKRALRKEMKKSEIEKENMEI